METLLGEDDFSKQIAEKLNIDFIRINPSVFPDGEIKPVIENEDKVKGKSVLLVIRSNRFRPSISDCIMKVYFLCRLLRKLNAGEINLFLPWMFYSRQDKKFLPGEPESLSDIADLYESLNISNIFTVNSHLYGKENSLQSYFKRIKIHDISPSRLFADYLKTKNLKNPIVIGPGSGPAVMVKELAGMLNAPYECLEKERDHETLKVFFKQSKSDFRNKDVIIYDDISAKGGTIVPTFEIVKQSKPNRIFIALCHLITKEGIERLYNLNSDEIIITDSFNSEEPIKFTELSLNSNLQIRF
jgi:ribose-phosphate pyrophosphokinase